MTIAIKRAYAPADDSDGQRILVDRLWPRGLEKQRAALDDWLKEVAPTPALRKWFGHRPERFAEFSKRYRAELADNEAAKALRSRAQSHKVTLIYAAHDEEHNHARVLRDFLSAKP